MLTPQQIEQLWCEYPSCEIGFARAIEAEVRKQDTELIQQMMDALETYQAFVDDAHIIDGQWHWLDDAKPAITAARARLENA